MKLDKNILNQIDSDFARLRREEVKKRNNTNKSRSKNQERQVAKYLGAARVPMSGAGMLKGDGLWNTPHGLLVYECKYTAAHNPHYGWTLRMQYSWLEKMQRDGASMKAKFSFLIIHFFNQIGGIPWGTVVIREEDILPFFQPEWLEDAFEYEHVDGHAAARMYYKEIRNAYKLNKAFPCIKLLTPHGPYVILPLWALKQLILGGEDDDSTGTDVS